MRPPRSLTLRTSAFTLMEIMVVIAIIIVLASILYPVVIRIQMTAQKNVALNNLRQLGSAMTTYAGQHDGVLANEDTVGRDTWESAKLPAADKAWYNALPRLLSQRGVGDFAREGQPAAFYTKESLLFLPGANYPDNRRLQRPYFPIAINTKLFRKDAQGVKPDLRLSQILAPTRTALFLEQGLPGEPKAHDSISNGDYDGSPKGSAKSFVARYFKRGFILFVDGNAAEYSGKQLLTNIGEIEWSADPAANDARVIWTPNPAEDPNGP